MLDRAAGEALLLRLDQFAAELARFRSEIVAQLPTPTPNSNGADTDDLPDTLIDTSSAALRFGFASDSIRKMCREIPGIGTWKAGRWQVRVAALRRHLERKNNQ